MTDPQTMVPTRSDNLTGRRRFGYRFLAATVLIVALALGSAASFSPAQTSMQLIRWKEYSCAKETRSMAGRMGTLDAVQRTGILVLSDGQFARSSGWVVHTAAPDGKEYYQGMVTYDFEDGSSILAKIDASGPPRVVPDISSASIQQSGTITFVAGTKRFKGITGRGTITSHMPSQWDMYAEIDATYNVPD